MTDENKQEWKIEYLSSENQEVPITHSFMIKSPGETQEIFLSCYNEGSFCYCNVFYSIDGKLSEEILPLSKDGLEFLLIGEIHVKSVDLLENIKFNPKLKFADG